MSEKYKEIFLAFDETINNLVLIEGKEAKLENPRKLTPFRHSKLTPFRRSKLTPFGRSKLTP